MTEEADVEKEVGPVPRPPLNQFETDVKSYQVKFDYSKIKMKKKLDFYYGSLDGNYKAQHKIKGEKFSTSIPAPSSKLL